jgi:hypothetical protein
MARSQAVLMLLSPCGSNLCGLQCGSKLVLPAAVIQVECYYLQYWWKEGGGEHNVSGWTGAPWELRYPTK